MSGVEGSKGFAAFRHRDFSIFIVAKGLATLSLNMVMVALAYQIYDLTGDPMNLAYIGLAILAPSLGFALVTGYVADRNDRRVVTSVCYVGMLVATLLFAAFSLFGDWTRIWPIYAILLLLGTARAFYQPAQNAIVPNLVPTEVYPNAVAWNTSITKLGQITGPMAGGLLYLAGPELVYLSAGGIFLVSILGTMMVKARIPSTGKAPLSLSVLVAGFAYVWHKKVILGAISLDLFVVLLSTVTALLPIFAKDVLEVGAAGAGMMRSAIAVGGVLTALVLTQLAMTRAVGTIMFTTVGLFGVATLMFGFSTWFPLSLLAMALLGATDMVSVYIRQTLVQIATPDAMRGRVSAVNAVFINTSNELGEFRAGAMAAWIGAVPAALVGGVAALVIAGGFWKLFPDLARVQRMDRAL